MQGRKKSSGKASSRFGSRRSMNAGSGPGGKPRDTKTFQQLDPKRRQGDFESTGEHARTGNRGHQ
jgi:hypothetical protein